MESLDRITFDANIMAGLACIRGMRIPASVILGQLAHGATEEEILAEYPNLEYVVLKRLPKPGLPRRESTHLRGF